MWGVVVIVILIAILITVSCLKTYEAFVTADSPILIGSRAEFERAVSASPFFKRMTPADLWARKAVSAKDYLDTYIAAFVEFTPMEKNRLRKLIAQIQYAPHIPWKFAKVATEIEKGYPHTLEDVIILSDVSLAFDDRHLMETLIHEKVHVFQRKEPAKVANIIRNMVFIIDDRRTTHPFDPIPSSCNYIILKCRRASRTPGPMSYRSPRKSKRPCIIPVSFPHTYIKSNILMKSWRR